MNPKIIDTAFTVVAALLTLCVFSYLFGWKAPYRLALHVLIGAGVAYAVLAAFWSVLYPRATIGLAAYAKGDFATAGFVAVAAILGVLFWTKLSRRLAWLGNISTAYLVGVGLGVAAGGALVGTLYTQTAAAVTARSLDIVSFSIGVLGTLTVLLSFAFTATWRKGWLKPVAQVVAGLSAVGRFFLYVTLGTVFAGVYVASVSVLIGRVQFLAPLVLEVLHRFGLG